MNHTFTFSAVKKLNFHSPAKYFVMRHDPEAATQVVGILQAYFHNVAGNRVRPIADLVRAVVTVPGNEETEGGDVYAYFKGRVPTARSAFHLGEALGPEDPDLSPHSLGLNEFCGPVFMAIAGRLKEFVTMIAGVSDRDPEMRDALTDLVLGGFDYLDGPTELRERTSPLLPKSLRMMCHEVLAHPKALSAGARERFGEALHAAANDSLPLKERSCQVETALLKALGIDIGPRAKPYEPTTDEWLYYHESPEK